MIYTKIYLSYIYFGGFKIYLHIYLTHKQERNGNLMLQGVILDMDGIIFDTEKILVTTEHETIKEMGYKIKPEDQLHLGGLTNEAYKSALIKLLSEDFDYGLYRKTVNEKIKAYYEVNPVAKMPGLDKLLDYLEGRGMALALASSTNSETIMKYLKSSGIAPYFSAVVGGDMVKQSKPHPEIYLRAAELLGISPSLCLAAEDSLNGLRSAAAAGCITLMIPGVYPPNDEARQLCAAILPSLEEVPGFIEFYGKGQIEKLSAY